MTLPHDKYEELVAYYGDTKVVSDGKNIHWSSKWEGGNLQTHKDMPGYEGRNIRCHNLIEPALRSALQDIKDANLGYHFDSIGCFSPRFKRHNPKLGISIHTFGAAIDIDAVKNFGKTFRKGKEPKPFSGEWRQIWPEGLPESIVIIFESKGFNWGGRWGGKKFVFIDPMHFQYTI